MMSDAWWLHRMSILLGCTTGAFVGVLVARADWIGVGVWSVSTAACIYMANFAANRLPDSTK